MCGSAILSLIASAALYSVTYRQFRYSIICALAVINKVGSMVMAVLRLIGGFIDGVDIALPCQGLIHQDLGVHGVRRGLFVSGSRRASRWLPAWCNLPGVKRQALMAWATGLLLLRISARSALSSASS
jgi:hypothetical protein